MSNDSTSGGYLTPISSGPVYDDALEQALCQWVLALSGLADGMVVPRWPPVQTVQRAADVNGCVLGITSIDPDASAAFIQQDEGVSALWRHETIECLASFYGPGGQQAATQFRDGVAINQNNEALNAINLSLCDMSALTPSPELINNQWVRRYDITVRLRRKVVREYRITSLAQAPFTFFGD